MKLPQDLKGIKQHLAALHYQHQRYKTADISEYTNRMINYNLHQSQEFLNRLEFDNEKYDLILVCDGARLGFINDEFDIDKRLIEII
jgi:hypothetical protein